MSEIHLTIWYNTFVVKIKSVVGITNIKKYFKLNLSVLRDLYSLHEVLDTEKVNIPPLIKNSVVTMTHAKNY